MFYNPATAIYSQFLPPLRGSIGWGRCPGVIKNRGLRLSRGVSPVPWVSPIGSTHGCALATAPRFHSKFKIQNSKFLTTPTAFSQNSKFKISCLRSGD